MQEAVDTLPRLPKAIIEAALASGGKADANRLVQLYGSTVNTIYMAKSDYVGLVHRLPSP